ncbi:MAG: hypothetical protein B1H03_01715 [Planctomycetales bacterium 4484_113]|nr:MAG: hypothetical protein B1H03_01715 [Planctomycetales bacterium 4484_113]
MSRLKQFLRIKWLLTLRTYTRRKWEGVLALATIAIVALSALLFGFVTLFAARSIAEAPLRPLLSTTLWLATALLLLLPTLHLDIAGSLDLSQMLIYPLGARDFLLLALVDGAVSPSGVIMLAVIVPLTLAFARDALGGLVFIILLLLLFSFVVSLSQLIAVVAMRLKASRRFVNLFLAAFAILVIGGQFLAGYSGWGRGGSDQQVARLFAEHIPDLRLFWQHFTAVMHFTPPAAVAESYLGWVDLGVGHFLLWLLILLAGAGLTLGATGFVYFRLFKGELALAESPRVRKGARARFARKTAYSGSLIHWLPAGLVATMRKEWRYLWREPYIKTQLIHVLAAYAYLAAMLIGLAQKGGGDSFSRGWIYLGIVYFLGMFTAQRFANKFGLDAEAIEVTLVTPIPRWQVLMGKGLPYILLFALTNGVAALLGGVLFHISPLFIFCAGVLVVAHCPLVDAVGNLVSIYFPVALIPGRGRRLRPVRQQQGCLFLLLHGLALNAGHLLTLPVAGLIALLAWSGSWLLAAPLVALAVAYVYFVARWLLRLSVRSLAAREPQIATFMLTANR